ncbi:MAG: (deoxy)nucleoside triphosphate pyrophosphohydrolase [Deltaproteobacteria bacterium]|nr:MAG: (deoxy)nucleoside triphosphate pyrophosphohydrolase [Deltaproteobacteria bacterium]
MGLVTAALIKDHERILIAQRNRAKRFGWLWEFPGGKLSGGETPEDCLRREILEELNLEIKIEAHFCTVSHRYPDFQIELMAFWCSIAGGSLQLNEHEQVRWVTVPEMRDYEFVGADLAVISALVSDWQKKYLEGSQPV